MNKIYILILWQYVSSKALNLASEVEVKSGDCSLDCDPMSYTLVHPKEGLVMSEYFLHWRVFN